MTIFACMVLPWIRKNTVWGNSTNIQVCELLISRPFAGMKSIFNNTAAHSQGSKPICEQCREEVLTLKGKQGGAETSAGKPDPADKEINSVSKAKLNEPPHLGMSKGCDICLQKLVLETRSVRQEKSYLLKYSLWVEDLQGRCNHYLMFTWLPEGKGKTLNIYRAPRLSQTLLCHSHFTWLNLDSCIQKVLFSPFLRSRKTEDKRGYMKCKQ